MKRKMSANLTRKYKSIPCMHSKILLDEYKRSIHDVYAYFEDCFRHDGICEYSIKLEEEILRRMK